MTAPLSDALREPITDLKSGMEWIIALDADGRMFHFEDDPESIINIRTNEDTFRAEDAPLLRARIASLYALDWGGFDCPIGFAIAIAAEETAMWENYNIRRAVGTKVIGMAEPHPFVIGWVDSDGCFDEVDLGERTWWKGAPYPFFDTIVEAADVLGRMMAEEAAQSGRRL